MRSSTTPKSAAVNGFSSSGTSRSDSSIATDDFVAGDEHEAARQQRIAGGELTKQIQPVHARHAYVTQHDR